MVCEGGLAVHVAVVLQGAVMVLEWGAMEEEVLVVDGLFIGSEAGVDAFEEDREGVGGIIENLNGVRGVVAICDDDAQG